MICKGNIEIGYYNQLKLGDYIMSNDFKVSLKQLKDGVEIEFPAGTPINNVKDKIAECAGETCTC